MGEPFKKTLSQGRLEELPEDDVGILPSDDIGILPSDDIGMLPSDNVGTLPSDNIGTLPSDNIGTIPQSSVQTLPLNNIGITAQGDVEPLPQNDLKSHVPHVFEPLKPNHIRILTLYSTKSRIECQLEQAEMSSRPYQTLSYVWGGGGKSLKAVIRDKENKAIGFIPLMTNLHDALCDLRDATELTSKVFWIDQICIDQENDDEKSEQVAMMGQIYKNAARTITYIGPAGDEKEEKTGIELMHLLYAHFSANYKMMFEIGSSYNTWAKRSELPVAKLPKELSTTSDKNYVERGWRWLCRVACGEWTTRLWMVQEQLLGKEVVMLRGSRLLSWQMVAMMNLLFRLEFLPQKFLLRFTETEHGPSIRALTNISRSVYGMWYRRRKREQTGFSGANFYSSLRLNLDFYNYLECHDARDRIFSVLSISSDAQSLAIPTDYSVDVHAVYLDASVRILKTTAGLGLLPLICQWASQSNQSHPSWALDVPSAQKPNKLVFGVCTPHPRTRLLKPPLLRQNSTVLVVKGRILDCIATSASPVYPSESYYNNTDDLAKMMSYIELLSSWSKVLRPSQAPMSLAIAASLCHAIISYNPNWSPPPHAIRSPIEESVFHLWCHYRYRVNVVRRLAAVFQEDTSDNIALFDSITQEMAALLGSSIDIASFDPSNDIRREEITAYNIVNRYALYHGRSFTTTDQGQVCSAMHEVKQGDAIAALQGTDRLYILRPVGNQYRLIGDAYVHSLMFGEAYRGLDPDKVDKEMEII